MRIGIGRWETLKFWLFVDAAFGFWRLLGRCPECHRKEAIAPSGSRGCTNEKCKRFDMCTTLDMK